MWIFQGVFLCLSGGFLFLLILAGKEFECKTHLDQHGVCVGIFWDKKHQEFLTYLWWIIYHISIYVNIYIYISTSIALDIVVYLYFYLQPIQVYIYILIYISIHYSYSHLEQNPFAQQNVQSQRFFAPSKALSWAWPVWWVVFLVVHSWNTWVGPAGGLVKVKDTLKVHQKIVLEISWQVLQGVK